MKTTVLKSILFVLLFASFEKIKAQSDFLFADVNAPGTSNSLTALNKDAGISIGNVIQNNISHTSEVKIKCQSPLSMKVKIFNMNGDLAKEDIRSLDKGVNELILDMNDLSAGVYMIQFYTNEGSALRRIVKNN